MTLAERIDEHLKKLKQDVSDVREVFLISEEGFPISTYPPEEEKESDPFLIASLFGGVASMANSALNETRQGNLTQMILEADKGITVMVIFPHGQTLTVIAEPTVRTGILVGYIRRLVQSLMPLLAEL